MVVAVIELLERILLRPKLREPKRHREKTMLQSGAIIINWNANGMHSTRRHEKSATIEVGLKLMVYLLNFCGPEGDRKDLAESQT